MEHLSPRQIAKWIAGEYDIELREHVESCAPCREEIGRTEEAFRQFRGSIHRLSEEQYHPARRVTSNVRPWRYFALARKWPAILALAASIAIAIGIQHNSNERMTRSVSDEALLDQIDTEVGREVPRNLEPLMYDTSVDAAAGEALRTGAKTSKRRRNVANR